jgi:hypothetical protein
VKTQHVTKSRGRHCGNVELAAYLANAAGPVPSVLDLRIAHDRFGSSSDLNLNGHLHYPNDIDKSLNEAAADKIRKYRADYNNNPPTAISFMPAVDSTSGSLQSEFVRLLFLQAHRETDRFFAGSGVKLAQHDRGQFHFRRAAFSSQLKSRVGLSLSQAAALRITLNLDKSTHQTRIISAIIYRSPRPEEHEVDDEEEEEEEEEEETRMTGVVEGIPSAASGQVTRNSRRNNDEGWLEQKKRAEKEMLAGDVEVDLSGYKCIAAKEMSDGDCRDVLQAATHHAREATRLIVLAAQSGCHRRQELLRAKSQAVAHLHVNLQALVKTNLLMVERGEAALRETVDPLFGTAVNLLSYAELSGCSAVSRKLEAGIAQCLREPAHPLSSWVYIRYRRRCAASASSHA